jgi:hypothetical protein
MRLAAAATLTIAAIAPAVIAPALMAPAAIAATPKGDDYDKCAQRLSEAGLNTELVANSCAYVARPLDLAYCVTDIGDKTDITPEAALMTCRSVRRPDELSTCAIDIHGLGGATNEEILSFCRRSLLPVRYGNCVTGLSNELSLSTPESMTICIDGRDRPRDFYPGYPAGLLP